MTPAIAPATSLLFAFAGVSAIGAMVATVAPNWRRIAHVLRNEEAPADHGSTGAPSLHPIADRRSDECPSFPSQARRGVRHITVSRRGETVAALDVAGAGR